MNADRLAQAWQRLAAAGVVTGEQPGSPSAAAPWYIAAMSGIAAWLAALFLLFFVGLALEPIVEDRAGAVLVGLVLCAISIVVMKRAASSVFVAQLAFAFSLAAQGLILAGLMMDGGYRTGYAWLIFAAFEAALVVLVEHGPHRVLATLATAFGVRMAMFEAGIEALFVPLLLAGFVGVELRVLAADRRYSLWKMIGIGLVLALLGALVADALVTDLLWLGDHAKAFAPVLLMVKRVALAAVCAAAAYVVARDAGARGMSPTVGVAMLLAAAVALAAYPIPGVAAAIVVMLMAFASQQHALLGLALVTLFAALGHYYYQLDTTLMVKSAALAGTGVILLVARAAFRRLLPGGDDRHA